MQSVLNSLNKFHIDDVKNSTHPATYLKQQKYSILILRLPKIADKGIVIAISYPFLLTENANFYYDRSDEKFIRFDNLEVFYKFMDSIVDETINLVNKFHSEIEDIEERLYLSKIKPHRFNENWLRYKKNLITCSRVLQRSNDAMKDFLNDFSPKTTVLKHGFDDIAEHIYRSLRSVGHATEKLDAIYNFQKTIINEKMNQTIYTLTIVSGIFLPLNLVVGFFGMNTSNLPYSGGVDGTYKVVGILFGIFFIASCLLYFSKNNK